MMNSTKWETTYRQTLEAVRVLARTSIYSVTEVLDEIQHDISRGRCESEPLKKELEFWNEGML